MKTINLLLANSDRNLSNLVEVQVRDLCYEQAVVNCTRVMGLTEFARQGSWMGLDLMIVTPDDLLPSESASRSRASIGAVIEAISSISKRHSTPILALGVSPQDEALLMEAGVDCVMGFPLNCEELRSAVSQALGLQARVERTSTSQWPFAGVAEVMMRSLQRLTQAS